MGPPVKLFCGTKKTTTTDDRTTVLVPTIPLLVVLFLGFQNWKKKRASDSHLLILWQPSKSWIGNRDSRLLHGLLFYCFFLMHYIVFCSCMLYTYTYSRCCCCSSYSSSFHAVQSMLLQHFNFSFLYFLFARFCC